MWSLGRAPSSRMMLQSEVGPPVNPAYSAPACGVASCSTTTGGYEQVVPDTFMFVGGGAGQYQQETVYKYVGRGGNYIGVAVPRTANCACLWWPWLLGGSILIIGFGLWWGVLVFGFSSPGPPHMHPPRIIHWPTRTWTFTTTSTTSTTTPCPTVWVPVKICPPGHRCKDRPTLLPGAVPYGAQAAYPTEPTTDAYYKPPSYYPKAVGAASSSGAVFYKPATGAFGAAETSKKAVYYKPPPPP